MKATIKTNLIVPALGCFILSWSFVTPSVCQETTTFSPPPPINPGAVNLNYNQIGGRKNPLANEFVYQTETDRFILTTGAGEKSTFEANTVNPEEGAYRLVRVEDPNGNYLAYTYQENPALNGYGSIAEIANSSGNWVSFEYDVDDRITALTASDGRTVGYEYSGSDLTKVIRPDNSEVSYEPIGQVGEDFRHEIKRVLKPHGQVLENAYEDFTGDPSPCNLPPSPENIRIVGQTATIGTDDQLTAVADIQYDPDTNYWTVIADGEGYQTTFSYDEWNRLTSVRDDDGNEREYYWNENNNLDSITDRNEHTRSYQYDDRGNVIYATDPLNYTTGYTYNSFNQVTRVSPPSGGDTVFGYDGQGNLLSRQRLLSDETIYEETVYQPNEHGEPISVTTAANTADAATTYLEYDGRGKVTKITNPEGEWTELSYDSRGNLLSIINPEEEEVTFTYDTMNRLTSIVDPLDRTVTFGYDQNGNLTSFSDALEEVTTYLYDKGSNLYRVEDPLGGITTFTRNVKGEITAVKDPRGNSTAYSHNLHGKIADITDPYGNTTTLAYDAVGNLTKLTDRRQNDTDYTYDAADRLKTIEDDLGNDYELFYDATGNVIKTVDQNGNITHYGYDDLGRLTDVTYKDPTDTTVVSSVSLAYDRRDNVVSRTDGRGETTDYEYDKADRLIKSTDPLGAETEYVYDLAGRLTDIINDDEETQLSVVYDPAGRPVEITDGEDNTVTYQYDDNDNIVKIIDPESNETEFSFDALNRLVEIENADDEVTTIERDANGNIIKIIDPAGNRYDYYYDGLNRLTKFIDGERRIIRFEYDANGNRSKIIDPQGNETFFSYDSFNRLTGITDASGNTTAYDYDGVGNVIERIDANGNHTEYQYDPLNRLTAINYPSDTSQNVSYQYDANGNIISATSPTGTLNFSYDAFNRMTSSSSPLGDIIYGYDSLGHRTSMAYPQSLRSLSYYYDDADRLIKITTASGDTVYEYDGNDNRTGITYPSGTQADYVYDGLNRLEDLNNTKSTSALISRYQFDFDALGNVIDVAEQLAPSTNIDKEYGYDRISQLIQEKVVGGETTDFTYDLSRNRLTREQTGGSLSYQYNEINELIKLGSASSSLTKTITVTGEAANAASITVNSVSATIDGNEFEADIEIQEGPNTITAFATSTDGKQTIRINQVSLVDGYEEFTYDDNGNLTAWTDNTETTTYYYDFENRLVEARRDGNLTASYTYDAFGRRDGKTAGGVTTKYIYDGLTFNPIIELDGSDNVKAVITRGPDMGGGISGIISVNRNGGGEEYFHYNHRGDVTGITDSSQNIIATYRYDAFGNLVSSTGSVVNPYRFSTKEYDEETGFYCFGFRYYAPSLGRFISQDPLRYIDGLNQYTYTLNNPLKYIDPFGLNAQNLFQWDLPIQDILKDKHLIYYVDYSISGNASVPFINLIIPYTYVSGGITLYLDTSSWSKSRWVDIGIALHGAGGFGQGIAFGQSESIGILAAKDIKAAGGLGYTTGGSGKVGPYGVSGNFSMDPQGKAFAIDVGLSQGGGAEAHAAQAAYVVFDTEDILQTMFEFSKTQGPIFFGF